MRFAVVVLAVLALAFTIWTQRVPVRTTSPFLSAPEERDSVAHARRSEADSPAPVRHGLTDDTPAIAQEHEQDPRPDRNAEHETGLVPCPPDFKDALRYFARLANREGVKIPRDMRLPVHSWRQLEHLVTKCNHRVGELETRRMSILEKLLDVKMARGEVQRFPLPETVVDGEARKELEAAISKARQAMHPDETVISGGTGPELHFVRIGADEDAHLANVYALLNNEIRNATAEVRVLLHPYLNDSSSGYNR